MGTDSPTCWIASEIYYPDRTSTGHLLTQLAEGLARTHRVAVLCAQPSYDQSHQESPSSETKAGVEIRRVRHPRRSRVRMSGRLINILIVTFRMWLAAFREFRRGDVVLVVTNPPLLPYAIVMVCHLRRARPVLLLHDVYPDAAVVVGFLGKRSIVTRLWLMLSSRLYRAVAQIVVVGRDMAELIASRSGDGMDRIVVIPNWADVDDITPEDPAENQLLRSLGLSDRFVIGIVGNMGRLQDVEMLLEAARLLRRRDPGVHFLFVGDGAKQAIIESAAAEPDSNVTTIGARPRAEQADFLNACHVAAITLLPGMLGVGAPSRLYNALAAGRPIIAALDHGAEAVRVILEENVGIHVPAGDPAAFASAVCDLRARPEFLADASIRARAVAERRFSPAAAIRSYGRVIADNQ
jgi:colanic acid biosynthesis glycosyl transferase WcaI